MCRPSLAAADDKRRGGDGDLYRRQPAADRPAPRIGEQLSLFPDQDFGEQRRRREAGVRH